MADAIEAILLSLGDSGTYEAESTSALGLVGMEEGGIEVGVGRQRIIYWRHLAIVRQWLDATDELTGTGIVEGAYRHGTLRAECEEKSVF